MSINFKCSDCKVHSCVSHAEYPAGCPTVSEATTISSAAKNAADDQFARKVMSSAQKTPRNENGTMNNRVEEIITFCKVMGFDRIGVGFCIALSKEANVFCNILAEAGLEVFPVCCKVGGLSPAELCVEMGDSKSISCNPTSQASILNSHNTSLNIAVGLCLGHDILFARQSDSPVTTLVVKDRALSNNTVQLLRETE